MTPNRPLVGVVVPINGDCGAPKTPEEAGIRHVPAFLQDPEEAKLALLNNYASWGQEDRLAESLSYEQYGLGIARNVLEDLEADREIPMKEHGECIRRGEVGVDLGRHSGAEEDDCRSSYPCYQYD